MPVMVGVMVGLGVLLGVGGTNVSVGVKVKVGPAVAQFGGQVDVLEKDEAARKMVLRGKGADKGGSSASMDLAATIEADPANPAASVLHGDAAVIVNGKFAQFGGRMMVQVSDMILAQFVENFRQAAQALPTPASQATAEDAAAAFGGELEAPAGAAPSPTATPAAKPAPVAQEINGLAIVWALIKNWWLGLFGKRT